MLRWTRVTPPLDHSTRSNLTARRQGARASMFERCLEQRNELLAAPCHGHKIEPYMTVKHFGAGWCREEP